MIIGKRFTFEASHVLPKHPGKCSRIHGHSWVLWVEVEGPVDTDTGFVVDYGELKRVVETHLINLVDHQHLGQGKVEVKIPMDATTKTLHFPAVLGDDFYASSENLLIAFWYMLRPFVNDIRKDVNLHSLRLEETCTSSAYLTKEMVSGHK